MSTAAVGACDVPADAVGNSGRTIKYEHVYKHVYASVADARTLIAGHIDWYNDERPHSSLQDQTPNEAYCASLPKPVKAA